MQAPDPVAGWLGIFCTEPVSPPPPVCCQLSLSQTAVLLAPTPGPSRLPGNLPAVFSFPSLGSPARKADGVERVPRNPHLFVWVCCVCVCGVPFQPQLCGLWGKDFSHNWSQRTGAVLQTLPELKCSSVSKLRRETQTERAGRRWLEAPCPVKLQAWGSKCPVPLCRLACQPFLPRPGPKGTMRAAFPPVHTGRNAGNRLYLWTLLKALERHFRFRAKAGCFRALQRPGVPNAAPKSSSSVPRAHPTLSAALPCRAVPR